MARGVNRVTLLGGVGKDPEVRASNSGSVIASFSLATQDREKNQSGEWVDKTEWHNLVAFGRTAEIVRDYVKKGSQLYVEGKITNRSWDDKETGQKKYKTEILVNELVLLGGKSEGGERPDSGQKQSSLPRTAQTPSRTAAAPAPRGQAAKPQNDIFGDEGITDDDIPF